ncbi:LPXTG cell wall anchor domain-containing protein [Nakamurella sp. YIM 132087]|uniref:LPXTG cell wall anchor domain-containing protein n=1 Tax=Nakamurella alba TaxID=2665158 RepID=A0A7K1FN94_9ACTN|nr:LPXTG cell wall anchor domain-containing protein [Nakamurella alba]MTD15635.1 LPXTG cell wall anchor domain-containing protein [Nakamurella alba]
MSFLIRTAAVVSATVLGAGALLAAPALAVPAEGPVYTTDPAAGAAGWLARQLVDGDHMQTDFGGTKYDDQGLTADVILALDSAKVGQDAAAAATGWLADNVRTYVGNGETESYAGALAKTILVADAQGEDPRNFGGVDLVVQLENLHSQTGRYSDVSEYGDYSNAITQSLAIIALNRTTDAAPQDAGASLRSLQCQDGGFALSYDVQPCVSDPDGTAHAIQALNPGESQEAALDYLEGIQQENGGFTAAATGGVPGAVNSNTTGLATAALLKGDRPDPAAAGMQYLTGLQVTVNGDDVGAIAYDGTGFDATTAPRATSQAILGLIGADLNTVDNTDAAAEAPVLEGTDPPTSSSSAPSSSSSAGSSTSPSSSSGSSTSSPSSSSAPVSSTSAPSTPSTSTPATTATTPATSTSESASVSADLGSVAQGGSVTVTVSGFLPGETARVELHSTPIVLGTFLIGADGAGSATVTIPDDAEAGQHEIWVIGETSGVVVTIPVTVEPSLAATGVSSGVTTLGIIGLVTLLLGGSLLLIARRRSVAAGHRHR